MIISKNVGLALRVPKGEFFGDFRVLRTEVGIVKIID